MQSENRKEYVKAYNEKYYKDPARYVRLLEQNKINRRKYRLKFQEYKASLSCVNCGFQHPAVIDFHHIKNKGGTKVNTYARNCCYKKAYEEVKNCIPLCSNCHRILHWKEQHNK